MEKEKNEKLAKPLPKKYQKIVDENGALKYENSRIWKRLNNEESATVKLVKAEETVNKARIAYKKLLTDYKIALNKIKFLEETLREKETIINSFAIQNRG